MFVFGVKEIDGVFIVPYSALKSALWGFSFYNTHMSIAGDIRRNLRIYSPPVELAAALKQLLTFNNPEYESIARHSPYGVEYTKVTPTICLATQYPKYLELPRGYPYSSLLFGRAKALFDKIEWRDLRVSSPVSTMPQCLTKLNFKQFKITLNLRFQLSVRK